MRGLIGAALAALLATSPGTAAAQAARPALPLQAQAQEIVGQTGGDWGVIAWSIDRGEPLFSIGADTALIPASNNKIFTSIWALDLLGPDYRFPTDLLITGEVENGVLQGHVVLRGSGDPAFGYPDYEEDPMDPLRRMAERLRSFGVRVVQGDVVGDPFVFDTALVGPEWPSDAGQGAAYYAPGVSGLAFQRNVVYVRVEPNGGSPVVHLEPPVGVIPIESSVRTGGTRAWAVRRPGEDTVRVRGSVSGRRLYRFPVGVSDPALVTAAALHRALLEAGIQVRGGPRVAETPENARILHRHYSIPLEAMLPQLNRDSDNFFAEHLWQAAVAEATGRGSWTRGGPAGALHFIRNAGVAPGQLYQFDGSGLSRLNRASALSLVQALVYAHGQPYSDIFHRSMAVGGAREGTLRRLFADPPAADNLHAKTGYIVGVRALSGYVRAANGELIAFSFIYNGRNTSGARSTQSELGMLLAGYGMSETTVEEDEGA